MEVDVRRRQEESEQLQGEERLRVTGAGVQVARNCGVLRAVRCWRCTASSRRAGAPGAFQGWTLLMWACSNGHEATASMLIEKGADVNAKDNKDVSPAHGPQACVRMAGAWKSRG
eukprot:2925635-Rhodomonas_salina.5